MLCVLVAGRSRVCWPSGFGGERERERCMQELHLQASNTSDTLQEVLERLCVWARFQSSEWRIEVHSRSLKKQSGGCYVLGTAWNTAAATCTVSPVNGLAGSSKQSLKRVRPGGDTRLLVLCTVCCWPTCSVTLFAAVLGSPPQLQCAKNTQISQLLLYEHSLQIFEPLWPPTHVFFCLHTAHSSRAALAAYRQDHCRQGPGLALFQQHPTAAPGIAPQSTPKGFVCLQQPPVGH